MVSESDSKKQLKEECIRIKEVAASMKIIPVKKGEATPFDVVVTIEPEDCKVDITQLVIEVRIDTFREYKISNIHLASTANEPIPRELLDEIQKRLLEKSNELFSKSDGSWTISELVNWSIKNFQMLVSSIPSCLEFYMSEGANGASIRRWALLSKTEIAAKSDVEEDEDEEAREYWRRRREEEERELIAQKEREAEQRRREVEQDPSLHAKVKILSIKEQQELKEARNKQGVRMAKTGSKRKKYQGEGSAAEGKKK